MRLLTISSNCAHPLPPCSLARSRLALRIASPSRAFSGNGADAVVQWERGLLDGKRRASRRTILRLRVRIHRRRIFPRRSGGVGGSRRVIGANRKERERRVFNPVLSPLLGLGDRISASRAAPRRCYFTRSRHARTHVKYRKYYAIARDPPLEN